MTRATESHLTYLFATLILIGFASAVAGQKRDQVNYRDPPRKYKKVTVDGRVFTVEQQLMKEAPNVAQRALARLNKNIDLALTILPRHAHRHLVKQRFYVMYGPKATGGGRDNGIAYFRPGAPKHNANRDEDWNSVVVLWHAENYTKLTDLWALKSVLHELAHAYHLEQWPEKQPDLLDAYRRAMAGNLYRNVENNKGGVFKAAYATVNQLEYFAEVSCMFFAECNYKPYDRSEFKVYDPAGYEMVRKLWKIGDKYGRHQPRTWTHEQTGRTLEATFKSLADGRVTLLDKQRRERKITLESLGAVDRDYVERWFDD